MKDCAAAAIVAAPVVTKILKPSPRDKNVKFII
jgi:hypothetical protein